MQYVSYVIAPPIVFIADFSAISIAATAGSVQPLFR